MMWNRLRRVVKSVTSGPRGLLGSKMSGRDVVGLETDPGVCADTGRELCVTGAPDPDPAVLPVEVARDPTEFARLL